MNLKFPKNIFKNILISIGITFILSLSLTNMYFALLPKEIAAAPNPEEEELSFWKNVIAQNPTYRDAYLYISRLEKKSGNTEASETALQEALKIDPNK